MGQQRVLYVIFRYRDNHSSWAAMRGDEHGVAVFHSPQHRGGLRFKLPHVGKLHWVPHGFKCDHMLAIRKYAVKRCLVVVRRVWIGDLSGWCRAGPWRSGMAYSRVIGAATAKGSEHVRVARRQDPPFDGTREIASLRSQ